MFEVSLPPLLRVAGKLTARHRPAAKPFDKLKFARQRR